MSHPVPENAQRLVDRLRMAADELESAARYGVPIPSGVSVNGYDNLQALGVSLNTYPEFDQWAKYASDVVGEQYDHDGRHWYRATGSLGLDGLTVEFAVSGPLDVAVTA